MRLFEIMSDAVKDELVNDLMDFLTAYHNKDLDEVPMTGPNGVLIYLKSLDHFVDAQDVMNLVSAPPFDAIVSRSTPERITLQNEPVDADASKETVEQSREKVDKDAEKQASKMVKAQGKL